MSQQTVFQQKLIISYIFSTKTSTILYSICKEDVLFRQLLHQNSYIVERMSHQSLHYFQFFLQAVLYVLCSSISYAICRISNIPCIEASENGKQIPFRCQTVRIKISRTFQPKKHSKKKNVLAASRVHKLTNESNSPLRIQLYWCLNTWHKQNFELISKSDGSSNFEDQHKIILLYPFHCYYALYQIQLNLVSITAAEKLSNIQYFQN